MQEMQKTTGGNSLHFVIKRVENYPDFHKLAQVIQHGLQGRGSIVKNFEGEPTEAKDLSLIL